MNRASVFPDYMFSLVMASVIAVAGLSYVYRVITRGSLRSERAAKIGGSLLVAQGVMDWWYWMMTPIAKGMAAIGMTPNTVTWLSLVFGCAAGAAIAVGRFGLALLLGVAGALLDLLDGFVARLTKTSSDAGEVLDAAVDRYTEIVFLGGLCIFYRDNVWLLSLTLAAALGSYMISYSTAKAEAMDVEPPRGAMRRHERATYLFTACGASSVTAAFYEPQHLGKVVGVPMVLSLFVVALVSNVSSVRRFVVIAQRVRAKELAQKSAKADVRSEQAPVSPAT